MDSSNRSLESDKNLQAVPKSDGTRPQVLVLGGTGYIGGRLVARLVRAGYQTRVLVRNPERLTSFWWKDQVEITVGDATSPEALRSATRGVDVLYYLIHSMASGKKFASVDREAAVLTSQAARSAGVGRIVYLGGLHPSNIELSPHLESRKEVGQILMRSDAPTLVLQAGVVIGSGSASFEMIRHLTEVLPYMAAPRWVRNFIQPIAVRDVLYYLLAAARIPSDVRGTVDIGGPDVLRYGQMMNGYALESGLPQRRIASLPVLTPGLASHWVNLVTPVPKAIARPLIESLKYDCVMRNHNIDGLIPCPPGGLTRYREAVSLALSGIALNQVETSWQDANFIEAPSDPLPSDEDWAGRTVYTDDRSTTTSASVARLWSVIEGIGGETGWYSPPILWAIRGWVDRLIGGVGVKRGRRNRSSVTVGDALDFWRVETHTRGQMLRLRAEMKVPGDAWLELSCEREGKMVRYCQRAIFFPRGLTGRLYWLLVAPFHGIVFAGMMNRIVAIAEAEESAPPE